MIRDGVIGEEEPVELIEGVLVTKMGKKRPHIQAGKKGLRILERIIPAGWHVAKEDPIVASDWSKPEPDLAVVRGEIEDYDQRDVTASDVALVAEIAHSSLSIDQTDMKRVYGASGIPVYWIINLVDRQIEVYTDPTPEGYRSSRTFKPGEDVPVVLGGAEVGRVAVSEILR
jgi:Uma2 family endonuclease